MERKHKVTRPARDFSMLEVPLFRLAKYLVPRDDFPGDLRAGFAHAADKRASVQRTPYGFDALPDMPQSG
jgi:hypothetical protein